MMEELEYLEFEMLHDHSESDSPEREIETFLMTSEEFERSVSPRPGAVGRRFEQGRFLHP
ncbi:hypothetical protein ACFL2P_02610 [Candidatus Moduliflexota bacterium]